MIRRNKNKEYIDKVIKEFKSFNAIEENREYEKYFRVYQDIKSFYLKQIKENKMIISVEKVRLEDVTGKNRGADFASNIALFTGFSVAVLTQMVSLFIKESSGMGSNIFTLVFTLGFIGYLLFKENKKENPKQFMAVMSLIVLNDIEKEFDEEKQEKKLAEKEERLLSKIDECKPTEESSGLLENVFPALMEIAASKVGHSLWERFKKKIGKK